MSQLVADIPLRAFIASDILYLFERRDSVLNTRRTMALMALMLQFVGCFLGIATALLGRGLLILLIGLNVLFIFLIAFAFYGSLAARPNIIMIHWLTTYKK